MIYLEMGRLGKSANRLQMFHVSEDILFRLLEAEFDDPGSSFDGNHLFLRKLNCAPLGHPMPSGRAWTNQRSQSRRVGELFDIYGQSSGICGENLFLFRQSLK